MYCTCIVLAKFLICKSDSKHSNQGNFQRAQQYGSSRLCVARLPSIAGAPESRQAGPPLRTQHNTVLQIKNYTVNFLLNEKNLFIDEFKTASRLNLNLILIFNVFHNIISLL